MSDRILAASRLLFARQGVAGTSITDVATEAGCSKATILYHYGSKANLFDRAAEPLAQDLTDLAARLTALTAPPPDERALADVITVAVLNRQLAGLASEVLRGQPPQAGQYDLATAIQGLVEAWGRISDPSSTVLFRFALLGMFAACQSSPDLDDEALTEALKRALRNLLLRP